MLCGASGIATTDAPTCQAWHPAYSLRYECERPQPAAGRPESRPALAARRRRVPSLSGRWKLCCPEQARSRVDHRFCPMRPFFTRCLVVLLALALVSSHAHGPVHLRNTRAAPCPEQHNHAGTSQPRHEHQHRAADVGCCCDCLSCSFTAFVTPELTPSPFEPSATVRYDAGSVLLAGRAPLPEPGPPKPVALI